MISPTHLPRCPVITALAFLAAAGFASAQSSLYPMDYMRSPQFRESFLGTLGVKSDIEPKVGEQEQSYLDQLQPHMADDVTGSIAALEKVTTPESSARLNFELGMLHFRKNNLSAAAEQLTAAVTKFDRFLRAHQNLGLIYTRLDKCAEALPHLTKAMSLGQSDEQTFGLIAYCHTQAKNWLSAESAYRNAIMLGPKSLDWKMGLARALFEQQKAGEAAALIDELLKEHPDKIDLWSLQAVCFALNKQPLRAAENFEFLALMNKATAENLNMLGDIYLNEGIYPLSAKAYTGAMTATGASPSPEKSLLAAERLAQRAAYAQANELLAAVDKNFPQMDDAMHLRSLKTQARVAMAQEATEAAVGILKEIIDTNPMDGEALLLLADHYGKHPDDGGREQSIFYLERALKVSSIEADAGVRLAQALMAMSAKDTDKLQRAEKVQRSIDLIKRSQELKPREAVGRYLADLERALTKMRGS